MNSFGRKNNTEKPKSNWKILTKETFGMVTILFATLCILCLILRGNLFAGISAAVADFLYGVFGWSAYLVMIGALIGGVELVKGKTLPIKRKHLIVFSIAVIVLISLAQTLTTWNVSKNYGKYLKTTYYMGALPFSKMTAGGAILGLFDGLLAAIVGKIGCCVIYSLAIVLIVSITVLLIKRGKPAIKKKKKDKAKYVDFNDIQDEREYPTQMDFAELDDNGNRRNGLFYGEDDFELIGHRRKGKEEQPATFTLLNTNEYGYGLPVGEVENSNLDEERKRNIEYIKKPCDIIPSKVIDNQRATPVVVEDLNDGFKQVTLSDAPKIIQVKPPKFVVEGEKQQENRPFMYSNNFNSNIVDAAEYVEGKDYVNNPQPTEIVNQPPEVVEERFEEEDYITNNFSDLISKEEEVEEPDAQVVEPILDIDEIIEPPITRRERGRRGADNSLFTGGSVFDLQPPKQPEIKNEEIVVERVEEPEEEKQSEMPVHIPYNAPPTTLFKQYPQTVGDSQAEQQEKINIIENTLEQFGISAKVVSVSKGPTVTRYELRMPNGISVRKVPAVADDLAMNLCAQTGVIIETPIPGTSLFGIQVENKNKVMVGLRDILESNKFIEKGDGKLLYSIGKSIVGNIIVEDLAKAPHLLVAGATGTGKSVCLNSLIVSLICKYGPEDLRLVLVDPKQVEFSMYAHLPNLLFDEIVTDVNMAIATLDWMVAEMERRYTLFADSCVSSINDYNVEIANDEIPKLPRIVLIVDELADFMSTRKRDMEERIQRLAAKARAAGIHLVLATQRPSVDVITGVIKANLPTRIACKVATAVDAGTIHGEGGAEKLLGQGDMLYKSSTMFSTERIQGSYVSNVEIRNTVKYIKENNTCYYDSKILEQINKFLHPVTQIAESVPNENMPKKESRAEELFISAARHVIGLKSASATNLQAKFNIGYNTATRLLQLMSDRGIVSEYEGSKSRRILMTIEEFEEKYGGGC